MPTEEQMANNIQRFDYFDAYQWLTVPFTKTDEGFLCGRAVVTNVGVFTYRNADGSIHTELRLPEEVFAKDSVESLKLKPITNNHPTEKVTAENVKQYQVGSLGDNPGSSTQNADGNPKSLTDGLHLAIDMMITEANAVRDVEGGKRALSCGYTCDLEPAPKGAVWCGVPYDFIQRNIRYNHVAIVDKARAGDEARIRMDSGAWVLDSNQQTKGGTDLMKTVKLDGVEYEAEAQVIAALTQATEKADSVQVELNGVKVELSKLTADRDTQKERADKAEADLKAMKEAGPDQTKIDAAVNAKFELLKNAQLAQVEIKADMSDEDIRKAVITTVFPNANLDGKDAVYVQARFDGAVEMLLAQNNNDAENHGLFQGSKLPDQKKENQDGDARTRMIEQMKKDSRGIQ